MTNKKELKNQLTEEQIQEFNELLGLNNKKVKRKNLLMTKKEVKEEILRMANLQEGDAFNPYFFIPVGAMRIQIYKIFTLKNKEDALTLFTYYMLEAERNGAGNNPDQIIKDNSKKYIRDLKWEKERFLNTKKSLIKALLIEEYEEGQLRIILGA
jgi:hypothetical protein